MNNSSLKLAITTLLTVFAFNTFAQQKIASTIQTYLDSHYDEMGLKVQDVNQWTVTDDVTSKKNGIRHVYLAQTINGIALQNGVANFTFDKNGNVAFVGNRFVADLQGKINGGSAPSISAETAIELAAKAANMQGTFGAIIQQENAQHYTFEKGTLAKENVKVDLVYWLVKDKVHLVWLVSLYQKDGKHWWQLFINAKTGEEVDRLDWVISCDFPNHEVGEHAHYERANTTPVAAAPTPSSAGAYNVFALPLESPNHGNRSTVTNPENTVASPFGWHDINGSPGNEYTITRGNNVYAYEDAANVNTPGFSPNGGSSLQFNFPYNGADNPSTYQSAAITNLFYTNNMMHDVWYNYGFDEASGNFQENNYGNGGAASDYVVAEAQDGGGTNNANFATPNDGQNPRMQMFLWSTGGSTGGNYLDVNLPAIISGGYPAMGAVFGPGLPNPAITANVVLVEDNIAPINDGCETVVNAAQLSGNIAIIDRGVCNFTIKIESAQNAGALAVIIVNNDATAPFQMGGTNNAINIPSIMISQIDGNAIKAQLALGTVNATISNGGEQSNIKDGDLDNGIIAHEYGHGISTRLTGGPSNSNCLFNAEQMGEGWSDWFGLMLTIEPGQVGGGFRGIGTYSSNQPTNGPGIRPAPYSTSFGVNPYTYGDSNNANQLSQPHGVGFVFGTVLWDLTWALIDQYGGVADPDLYNGTGGNNIAMDLVIEGLKIQPCNPGMIDGRDAIIAADQLLYGGMHRCLIWNAFANRGFGFSANQGSSNSRTDQTEAFDLPPNCEEPTIAPVAAFIASDFVSCSATISFEDNSTEIPQSWLWDFDDNSTSTLQNPTHIFTSSGTYAVELTATNSVGSNTTTQQVTINLPDAPLVTDVGVCLGETADLNASVTGVAQWRNVSEDVIFLGNTLVVPNVTTTQTFSVENLVGDASEYINPANNTLGVGGYHNSAFHGALNFTADQAFEIVSAWVDADGAGSRTIYLASGINNDGAAPGQAQIVDEITVDLIDGPQRIYLNLMVPEAGNFNIGANNVGLYRNSNGANYPYMLATYMTVNNSSATTASADFYYYFYDMELRHPQCVSAPETITVGPITSSFIYVNNSSVVSFTDASINATSWFWDFGDGNTSTEQNPTHTFAQLNTYTVTLTINGETTCEATEEILIDGLVGIADQETENVSMSLSPNPARNETTLLFSRGLETDANLRIYAIDGRIVQEFSLNKGVRQTQILLNGLAAGSYRIVLDSEKGRLQKRLVVVE